MSGPRDFASADRESVDTQATAFSFGDRRACSRTLSIPTETPVEIAYGGLPFAVMMMTPADLEDFAVGFSLTEAVIEAATEMRGLDVQPAPEGLRLAVDLAPERLRAHLARRRALSGRSGCGICGVADLASLERGPTRPLAASSVPLGAIQRAVAELDGAQSLGARTRATHAAAWADSDGRLLHVREDVGRHNALDKLVGCLLRAEAEPGAGFVLITSRCSFEMVDKAATFGAGVLVAVSAPTALAIERARRLGMTLLGVARHDGVLAFTGEDRVVIG